MNKDIKWLRDTLSSRHLALNFLKECQKDSQEAMSVLPLLRHYFDNVVKKSEMFDNIEQAIHNGLRCVDEINAQSVKFNLFWRMAFEHEQAKQNNFDVFPCLSSLFFRHENSEDFPDELWYKVMFNVRVSSEQASELEYYYPVQTLWGNMLQAIYLTKQEKVLSRLDDWGLFDLAPSQIIWFCNHFMVENNQAMDWYLNDGHNSIRYRFFKFLAEKGGLQPYSKSMNKMFQYIVHLENHQHKNGFIPDEQIRKRVEMITKS